MDDFVNDFLPLGGLVVGAPPRSLQAVGGGGCAPTLKGSRAWGEGAREKGLRKASTIQQ